jgi:hypothetical protein
MSRLLLEEGCSSGLAGERSPHASSPTTAHASQKRHEPNSRCVGPVRHVHSLICPGCDRYFMQITAFDLPLSADLPAASVRAAQIRTSSASLRQMPELRRAAVPGSN